MVQLCEQPSLAVAAQSYLSAGLCVLPANLNAKKPAVISWKAYQSSKPSDDEVSQWFSDGCHKAMCIVASTVSGNVEMLDFDCQEIPFVFIISCHRHHVKPLWAASKAGKSAASAEVTKHSSVFMRVVQIGIVRVRVPCGIMDVIVSMWLGGGIEMLV